MNDKTWFNKGIDLAMLGKYVEAIEAFEKAIEINPNFVLIFFNIIFLLNIKEYFKSHH